MTAHKKLTTFDRDHARANLLRYTRKAFSMLPKLNKPRILDIGCGTGVSTLELARISGGNVVAVDIDRNALDQLVNRFRKEGLVDRIKAIHISMQEMKLPSNSFDIIWSEGAIANIGFKRGLSEWRDLLAPKGFLVVHDAMTDLPRKIELTRTCGYTMLGQSELPPNIWWNEYYAPLKRQLKMVQEMGSPDDRVINEIRMAEREIREFDSESNRFGSVFFVLKRV
jgi:ubiquinone/menaquinone biosynthesis C-methylase UbiE